MKDTNLPCDQEHPRDASSVKEAHLPLESKHERLLIQTNVLGDSQLEALLALAGVL